MFEKFKKYGWVLGLVGVCASSLVGAIGTNRLIAEKLAPPEKVEGLPPPGAGARSILSEVASVGGGTETVPGPEVSEPEEVTVITPTWRPPSLMSYEVILSRNLFDSEHSLNWPESVNAEADDEEGGAAHEPLALRLFGTVVAHPQQFSWAHISKDDKNATPETFGVGEDLYNMGTLHRVRRNQIVVALPEGGETVVDLYEGDDVPSPPTPKKRSRRDRKKKDKPELGETVRKLGENRYEIDSREIQSAMENMDQLARGARIVPSFENGEPIGFKVFRIKRNSLYSKLGVKNGDIISKVNGFEINSTERALQIYQMLRTEKNITLDVVRRGKNMSLDYVIR